MNELEIKKLWQTSNNRLEDTFEINKNKILETTQNKIYGFLNVMKPIKLFVLCVGILWVCIGAFVLGNIYINTYNEANKFFLYSATIQVGLTAIALIIYLYQLITIYQIDITTPIISTQEKLTRLKLTTLWVTRILLLQLPVWTTFWWNKTMWNNWNGIQWTITIGITIIFTIVALWLFLNIKIENRNKKWFQLIFNGQEWTPLITSLELINQLEDYKN